MRKIINKDNKILRQKAKEVPVNQITKIKIQKIIKEMFEALAREDDGVALAAPQIGESLRIFVVSPKLFEKPKEEHLVFINPQITRKSKDRKKMDEGCLSCRWYYGTTKRSSRAEVEAYDEKGKKFKVVGTKLMAQIFQHEIDHFDGILFIDHATDIQELKQNKYE